MRAENESKQGTTRKKTQSEAEKDLDRSGNEPTVSAREGARK